MRPASIDAIDAVELMELLDFIAEICAHRDATLCTVLCALSGTGYDAEEIAQDCRRLHDAIVVAKGHFELPGCVFGMDLENSYALSRKGSVHFCEVVGELGQPGRPVSRSPTCGHEVAIGTF